MSADSFAQDIFLGRFRARLRTHRLAPGGRNLVWNQLGASTLATNPMVQQQRECRFSERAVVHKRRKLAREQHSRDSIAEPVDFYHLRETGKRCARNGRWAKRNGKSSRQSARGPQEPAGWGLSALSQFGSKRRRIFPRNGGPGAIGRAAALPRGVRSTMARVAPRRLCFYCRPLIFTCSRRRALLFRGAWPGGRAPRGSGSR